MVTSPPGERRVCRGSQIVSRCADRAYGSSAASWVALPPRACLPHRHGQVRMTQTVDCGEGVCGAPCYPVTCGAKCRGSRVALHPVRGPVPRPETRVIPVTGQQNGWKHSAPETRAGSSRLVGCPAGVVYDAMRSISRMRSMMRSTLSRRCSGAMLVLPSTSVTQSPSAAKSARAYAGSSVGCGRGAQRWRTRSQASWFSV